ncbi:MAG: transcriptional regulator [Phascolarctobacterium sp.]|nr:MAG: transcriptional regulator [Phascolarctobacterium sp.]
MNTSERLRYLRIKAGYSQQDMANKLNINRTTYVKYETGDSKPLRKLTEIASIFNVTVDYLLGNEFNQENKSKNTSHIFTRDELEIIKKYRQLDTDGKNLVKVMINKMLQQLQKASKSEVI